MEKSPESRPLHFLSIDFQQMMLGQKNEVEDVPQTIYKN